MGDANKDEIEKVVSNLQPTLQTRLRFLVSGSTDHSAIATTTHLWHNNNTNLFVTYMTYSKAPLVQILTF